MRSEIVVVTGSGSGIGEATARGFGQDGYRVVVADIDTGRAEAVADGIRTTGGDAISCTVDVSDTDSVASLVSEVKARLGMPSVLVNGAGWDEIMPFVDTKPDFWKRVLAINLLGTIAMTHGFFDCLVATKGRLVNVSSDAGRVGSSGETVYAGAKAGIVGFTKSVAREFAKHGVTANCVCPGPINTPFLDKNPPGLREALSRAIPMRRVGETSDVWNAIRFFAAPESSYITGQVLSVSGGLTMSG
ncbi:MAG TPA: SDR family oxidoreductase [Jatrophihabitantaceae bacterium]|jgi:2-hydroxycyclohexanecarboxyl-CoA dehydrogenase|nr:SDR family oxidoreductase [Jatrophihabitantaceae bacterium]